MVGIALVSGKALLPCRLRCFARNAFAVGVVRQESERADIAVPCLACLPFELKCLHTKYATVKESRADRDAHELCVCDVSR